MTTPLIDGPVAVKTAPTSFSFPQAYADAGCCRKQAATTNVRNGVSCKPRANCLKSKEIRFHHFDLSCALNYLKVKRSQDAGRHQEMMHDP
jgi:hypothetical protein